MGVPPDFQVLMDRMTVAYRAGDASACADMFTMDAQLYSPYAPPAVGRGAIEAIHREWTDGGVPDKELKVLQTGGSNDFAWTLSSYSEDGGKGNVLGSPSARSRRELANSAVQPEQRRLGSRHMKDRDQKLTSYHPFSW
ncbi:ketosteroid isomerase-like protein [Sinorhizobium fredii]